jgi:RNA polymerase sigma factor (sigma-70 family)
VSLDVVAASPDTGEDDLARSFTTGDPESLRRVYDQHAPLVYSFCRRTLLTSADAEDATQQVFLIAWQRRERFDPDLGSLPGWLVGITKNVVRDAQRKRARLFSRRDRITEAAESTLRSSTVSSGVDPDAIAERMLMADALGRLGPEQRKVIELSFYAGLTHAEIATELDMPLGTVKSHARRGLTKLKHHLEAGDGD